MTDETTANDGNDEEPTTWRDDRARQDTLQVGARCEHTRHREPRIDEAGSDEFADDRDERDERDDGSQAALGIEAVDDGNQRDLTGDVAGDTPAWAEGDR